MAETGNHRIIKIRDWLALGGLPLRKHLGGKFVINVVTLMTGTIISQAIMLGVSPILTRIYSPTEFGLFAIYMSIVSLFSVIATGRYEMSVLWKAQKRTRTF